MTCLQGLTVWLQLVQIQEGNGASRERRKEPGIQTRGDRFFSLGKRDGCMEAVMLDDTTDVELGYRMRTEACIAGRRASISGGLEGDMQEHMVQRCHCMLGAISGTQLSTVPMTGPSYGSCPVPSSGLIRVSSEHWLKRSFTFLNFQGTPLGSHGGHTLILTLGPIVTGCCTPVGFAVA
jgi:hypothetical protein